MITGVLPFYYANCSQRFMGISVEYEWRASTMATPVKYPKC